MNVCTYLKEECEEDRGETFQWYRTRVSGYKLILKVLSEHQETLVFYCE